MLKKTAIISVLMILLFFRYYLLIVDVLTLGLDLRNDIHTDYYFYHFVFTSIWNQDTSLIYNCSQLKQAGEALFEFDFPPHACYLYPPHFAVVFSFLGAYSYETAKSIWNALSNIMYISGVLVFLYMFFNKQKYLFLIFLLLSLLFYPFYFDFQMSNSNRLIFFLMSCLFYFNYYRKRPIIAGVFLGLAIVFKLSLGILLLFYILLKQYKITLSTVITVIISTVITGFFVGFNIIYEYATSTFWQMTPNFNKFFTPIDNSIQGFIMYYSPNASTKPYFILYVFIISIFFVYLLKKCKQPKIEIGLLSLTPIAYSPHFEVHHAIVLFFTLVVLIDFAIRQRSLVLNIMLSIILYIFVMVDYWEASIEYFILLVCILIAMFYISFKTYNNQKMLNMDEQKT